MSKEQISLLIYVAAVLLCFVVFIVVFVIAFQKRKNKFLIERIEAQQRFEREIETSRLEIQEQTLRNIAWELHDNVGQLLSVVNMQLNLMIPNAPEQLLDQLNDAKTLVSETVQEVRTLSKTLNHDVIVKNGLVASVKVEVSRFNKLQFLVAELKVIGEEITLFSEHDIIIFRILQEFFSNVIKHAKAKKLFVLLDYQPESLKIVVEDDGVGFNMSIQSQNSGLETMKKRAALIHARFNLISSEGNGTKLELNYPYLYAQNGQA